MPDTKLEKQNYGEAVAYINEIPKFTQKNKLEHTKECLKRLGNPQEKFRVIHVAGTNGKGSVCAFLTSILREAGYRCGLFTSPHLVKLNERFQINEETVSDRVFLEAFHEVRALSRQLAAEGDYHPTYFEFLFLMGMVIFAREGVEFVTLETGLGGRLDATNSIAEPLLAVITSISLDHVQYLGNTVAAIAGEKAGILKPGIPVIYDANSPEAAAVIGERARELSCPAEPVQLQEAELLQNTPCGLTFTMRDPFYRGIPFTLPFAAEYQMQNGALALQAAKALSGRVALTREAICRGMASTRWQGRMEPILSGVIVDGAHNEDGIRRFIETACRFQKDHVITLLFSAVNDKEYPEMIRRICEGIRPSHVVTATLLDDRAVSAEELQRIFISCGCPEVTAFPRTGEAFEKALDQKGKDGLLFCVGSLYLVGEIKEYLQNRKERERP